MCGRAVAVGVIARPSTVRRRQSITASHAGHAAHLRTGREMTKSELYLAFLPLLMAHDRKVNHRVDTFTLKACIDSLQRELAKVDGCIDSLQRELALAAGHRADFEGDRAERLVAERLKAMADPTVAALVAAIGDSSPLVNRQRSNRHGPSAEGKGQAQYYYGLTPRLDHALHGHRMPTACRSPR